MEANLVFYILNTLVAVAVALLGLRFLLQLAQANYYNPISQGINRFAAPIIGPFASLPTIGSVNFSVLAAAVVVQGLGATLCFLLLGGIPGVVQLIVWSVLSVFGLLLDLVFYALIGMIILSWLAPNASHPGAEILMQVSEPFMEPFRKIMPDMGGLDLSPILLFIVINVIEAFVVGGARSMGLSSTVAQFFVGLG